MAKKKEVESRMHSFVPKIEMLDPKDLIPYSKNSKKHPPEQVQAVANQIWKYGFDQPIVVDEKMLIIKGHGRHRAVTELRLKKVPVIVRADLSEAEKKAIRIADNKVAESEWDKEFLKFELASLSREDNFDLTDTGFELDAIDKLLSEGDVKPERSPKEKTDAQQWIVSVHCKGEEEMKKLYEEMKGRGLEVKLIQ